MNIVLVLTVKIPIIPPFTVFVEVVVRHLEYMSNTMKRHI